MTLVIVVILLLAYILIATESVTNVNKAAVAIFAGTVGWVLYICYGSDFVMSQHPSEYLNFLDGMSANSIAVKKYIASNIFLKYVGRSSEVVLFLLSTMTIVEILNNNGCFDFISQLLKTRSSKRMLWTLSVVTFLLSANLDNLTTTVMMLTIMHKIIPNRRQRMVYGSAIVLAANSGGILTVIGSPAGLVMWNIGAVTPTDYSLSLLLPCLIAWLLPTFWLAYSLPNHVETEWNVLPFRGNDTNLNVWQRLLMLFVGIGGLWFIPTFHNITKLSPFLGALCVVSILWIVNEIFNRKLFNADQMLQSRVSGILQYGVIQMILFVMGMMLALGVVKETGAFDVLANLLNTNIRNVWIIGLISGLISTFLDNFALAMNMFSIYDVQSQSNIYWKVIAYSTAIGGNVLTIGSMSGLALARMERMHVGWFFRNVGYKAAVGFILGLCAMYFIG